MAERSDRLYGLMEFGLQSHIRDFVNGTLYMNTLSYFTEREGDFAGHDRQEGTAHWYRGELRMKVDDVWHAVEHIVGPMSYRPSNALTVNVFCMYAFRDTHFALPKNCTEIIDRRNLAFGDTFAAILDRDELLRRLRAAELPAGNTLEYHLVQYVDINAYEGPVGPFRKSNEFLYQSEFRIVMAPGTDAPFRLSVGDLSDICLVGTLSEINNRVTFG